MNISRARNLALLLGLGASGIVRQLHDQPFEVEAMTEPIGKGSAVLGGVVDEVEGLVPTAGRSREVTQNRVDAAKREQLARLTLAHDDVGVRTVRIDAAGKSIQPIAEHARAKHQVRSRPVGHGLEREARQRRHLRAHKAALGDSVDRHRCGYVIQHCQLEPC
jgi:hypothetical protein